MERLGDLTLVLLALDEAEPGNEGGRTPRSWEQGFSRQSYLGSLAAKLSWRGKERLSVLW